MCGTCHHLLVDEGNRSQNKVAPSALKCPERRNTIISSEENWLGRKDSNLHRPH